MLDDLPAQRQRFATGNQTRRWVGRIAIAAAVGLAYFLVAQITVLGLVLEPDSISVFWPAAGVSTGALIALGPRGRWPAAAGIAAAEAVIAQTAAQEVWHNLWVTAAVVLCDTAEPLITAGLIARVFGAGFALDRVGSVLGLLAASVAGAAVSTFGAAVALGLYFGPSISMLIIAQHWFVGLIVGVIAVAPLVIGIAAALRQPPPRSECAEAAAALVALAMVTAVIVSLPRHAWEFLLPVAWSLPILLWLAARSRPVFAAAGAFLVSNTIVWTTTFGIGHFGDASFPLDDSILGAQTAVLFVAVSAHVLAALFAERRESEARLIRANVMLEREQDNKLMNVEAVTAALSHEVKQPLTAIVINGGVALRYLDRTPPDLDAVRGALSHVIRDSHRAGDVFESIRALFRKGDQGRHRIDVNEMIIEVLQSLRAELHDHAVELHPELGRLPLVDGHKGQLQEVVSNLLHNALEAMNTTADRNRVLRVRTELRGGNEIAVAVEDSGPGIDPDKLDGIFKAFFTTKSHGMGLGLAICRMIVERHGGKLTAASDGKTGARFQFVLPIGPQAQGATAEAPAAGA